MDKKKFKIMVVDDSKFMRMLFERILKEEGYEVKSYELATHARQEIDDFSPDMILSDFMMPEMNGYEFCELVKKKEKRDVKFILVTSVTDVNNKVKCFEVGADDYLKKPFALKELLHRINAICKRSFNTHSSTINLTQDISFNIKTNILKQNGEEKKLTQKELELLKLLIKNRNLLVNLNTIYDVVLENESSVKSRARDSKR